MLGLCLCLVYARLCQHRTSNRCNLIQRGEGSTWLMLGSHTGKSRLCSKSPLLKACSMLAQSSIDQAQAQAKHKPVAPSITNYSYCLFYASIVQHRPSTSIGQEQAKHKPSSALYIKLELLLVLCQHSLAQTKHELWTPLMTARSILTNFQNFFDT